MKLNILFLFLFSILLISSCEESNQSSSKTNLNDPAKKDISELTYLEIYRALFADNNGGFDQHGDLYGQEAVPSLSFSEEQSSCGNAIFLTNTSTKDTIMLALKASFDFPGNPTKEITRAYGIKPSEKISVGNTKLCYNRKEYDITRAIISAGFIDE